MNEKFRKVFLSLSSLYVLAGLTLIIWPDVACKAVCIAAGCILVLAGLLQLVICWKEDSLGSLDGKSSLGVLLLIAGVLLLTQFDAVISLLIALMGLFLAVDGFAKLQLSCSLKRLGASGWKRDIIASITLMAIGVFLVFDPFSGARAMVIVTGVVLLLNGLINLWMTYEVAQVSKRVAQGLPANKK